MEFPLAPEPRRLSWTRDSAEHEQVPNSLMAVLRSIEPEGERESGWMTLRSGQWQYGPVSTLLLALTQRWKLSELHVSVETDRVYCSYVQEDGRRDNTGWVRLGPHQTATARQWLEEWHGEKPGAPLPWFLAAGEGACALAQSASVAERRPGAQELLRRAQELWAGLDEPARQCAAALAPGWTLGMDELAQAARHAAHELA